MVEAFVWGLIAGGSLLLGAAIVSLRRPHRRALGLVMGFGSGVLISAVSFELVQEAVIVADGEGGVPLGFFTGAAVFLGGDLLISRLGHRGRGSVRSGTAGALAIVLGIVLDGVPESAVIGLTLLQAGTVGVSILVAVFISNVPESIAATSGLRQQGWPWSRLYLMWSGTALLCALASAAGYTLLDGASPRQLAFTFAFAGGAILAMLSTTMIPEAYEYAGRLVGLATTFGFGVAFAITWISE
jgi:zinc transporter, ZIP family